MAKKRILFIILIGVFLFVNLNSVSATTYYVDGTNGNDLNDGLTIGTAWKTIGKANTAHLGGDTVYILPGEYRESLFPKGGIDGNQRTVYSGLGNREQVKILGSDEVTGWTQCNPGTDPCTSTNVYYAGFNAIQTRCERVDSSNTNVYSTDCWEDRSKWYIRADLVGTSFSSSLGTANVDAPGEYYYDNTNSRVYIYPFNSDDPNTHTIECSKRRVGGIHQWWDPVPPGYLSANNLTIQNLSILQSYNHGFQLSGGQHNIDFINNEFAWISGPGSCQENPAAIIHHKFDSLPGCQVSIQNNSYFCHRKGINVIGNVFHDLGSDVGPGINGNGRDSLGAAVKFYDVSESLVANNEIYNVNQGIHIKERNANDTIRNNVVYNFSTTGAFFQHHVYDLLIEGNLFYNGLRSSTLGIGWYGDSTSAPHGSGASNNNNMTILHNVFWNVGRGILISDIGYSTGHDIRNNVFESSNYEMSIYERVSETSPQHISPVGYISDNNTLYGSLLFRRSFPRVELDLAGWQAFTGQDNSPLLLNSGDPLFVDINSGNFNLDPNSQAIDAGQFIPGYHCSQSGYESEPGCRVWYGSAPDIGAYEYNPGAPQPVTCNQVDVNDDLVVNIIDLALVIYNQGQTGNDYQHLDINTDGLINFDDVNLVIGRIGEVC